MKAFRNVRIRDRIFIDDGKIYGMVQQITKDFIQIKILLPAIMMKGLNFESFGIMVARGDLAVEVGPEYLSFVQEEIVTICSAAYIPVIWATRVLETLTKKGIPARSEITDASQGNRANCVMLNKGHYIVESLKM